VQNMTSSTKPKVHCCYRRTDPRNMYRKFGEIWTCGLYCATLCYCGRMSIRPSVRHTSVLYQNDWT